MNIVSERPSDIILNSLNRLSSAKKTAALKPEEFSKLIEVVGDLAANKIKQGKMTEEQIDSLLSYDNLDYRYFSLPHKDLEEAFKRFSEGIYMAQEQRGLRFFQAKQVFKESDYRPGFKRL